MNLVTRIILLVVAATPLAWAADEAIGRTQWVIAPGPAVEVCEPSQREPEVRLGPRGIEHIIAPPKCRQVRTGRAPTYHLDGRQLIPSQQSVPEGLTCLRTLTIDHHTYGQTAGGGSLWALCTLH